MRCRHAWANDAHVGAEQGPRGTSGAAGAGGACLGAVGLSRSDSSRGCPTLDASTSSEISRVGAARYVRAIKLGSWQRLRGCAHRLLVVVVISPAAQPAKWPPPRPAPSSVLHMSPSPRHVSTATLLAAAFAMPSSMRAGCQRSRSMFPQISGHDDATLRMLCDWWHASAWRWGGRAQWFARD